MPPRPHTGRMAAPPKNSSWNLPWIPKPKARASRDEVDDFKRREEQKAAEEKEKQRQEMASWEGAASHIARLAYEQALKDGKADKDAYYYAIQIKKICEELSDEEINAVLEDVNTNHDGDILSYFFVDRDVLAMDTTTGDTITVQKTDFEYFMLKYFKNDFRMEDVKKFFWTLGQVSMRYAFVVIGGKLVLDLLAMLKVYGDVLAIRQMLKDENNNGNPDILELLDPDGDGNIGHWNLPENGEMINGRYYTKHALERMAPDIIETRAILEQRAHENALNKGLIPGTKKYYDFVKDYVQPRGIPPMLVEDAIKNGVKSLGNMPGTYCYTTSDIVVIINSNGDVITVVYPR